MLYACEGIGNTVHVDIEVNDSKSIVVWLTHGKLLHVGADYINTVTGEVVYQRKASFAEVQHAVSEIRTALLDDNYGNLVLYNCGCGENISMILDTLASI